jgi:hypothetical protein
VSRRASVTRIEEATGVVRMFAMKWIASNGSEMIYAGRDISLTPALQSETKRAMVTFYDQNDTHCSLDTGRVFVMNDHGRTIASYDLDDLSKGILIEGA